MPVFFLLVGILLIVVGVNDKTTEFGDLIREDFAPSNNTAGFHIWIVAIAVIGSIGYIKGLKPVSNAFLVLLIIAMLLSNKGFFTQFTSALESAG